MILKKDEHNRSYHRPDDIYRLLVGYGNICTSSERVHIFPYPTNNLFITYALLSQKALWHLFYNFYQQNLQNNICIKQTKIEIQNESKTIVATSVS